MTAVHDLEEAVARLHGEVDTLTTENLRLTRQVDALLAVVRRYELEHPR